MDMLIDLQTQTITHVLTQGAGNSARWATAYYLHYSEDGYRWTNYSESGDVQHSNVSKMIFSWHFLL